MKTLCNVVVYVVLALVVIFAGMLLLPQVCGLNVYGVLSGSMEPGIHKGSIIYVKPAKADEVKVDDVITFKLGSSETICTHRIVEKKDTEQVFITKGDASDNLDLEPVPYTNLIGAYKMTIPYVGYVAQFMQSVPGYITAAALLILMIVCSIVADAGRKKAVTATAETVAPVAETVAEPHVAETASTITILEEEADTAELGKKEE